MRGEEEHTAFPLRTAGAATPPSCIKALTWCGEQVFENMYNVLIENLRCSKANRSGDICHCKDSLLVTVSREGGTLSCTGPHKEASGPAGRQREKEEWWAGAFIVVCARGSGGGQVSRQMGGLVIRAVL